MTSYLIAIIDGLIQGVTEFLPISSSAHLYLSQLLFETSQSPLTRVVLVHLGTLAGAAIATWPQVKHWYRNLREGLDIESNSGHSGKLLYVLVSSLPILVAGVLIGHWIEGWYSLEVVATTTLGFGLLLGLSLYLSRGRKGWQDLGITPALVTGCAQVLALIPGVSRSGICLTTLWALGFRSDVAARFTVLSSIPVLGALALWFGAQLWTVARTPNGADLLAAVIAAIAAWAIVHYGLAYLERSRQQASLLWLCVGWRLCLGSTLVVGLVYGW